MGNQSGYTSYKNTNISTADRGKLIIMVYDHCIKWCKLAQKELAEKSFEKFTKAVFKVQDGITELTCALDMDNGGEIANNLFSLYTFYNRHLNTSLRTKEIQPVIEVQRMLSELRESWIEAVEIVRRADRSAFRENSGNQIKMVG